MAISCAHCGGTHAVPAEVKACWAHDGPVATPAGVPGVAVIGAAIGPASLEPPPALGRNLVIAAGASVPAAWAAATRVTLDPGMLESSDQVLTTLQNAAGRRRSVVIELGAGLDLTFGPEQVPAPAVNDPPHRLGARFSLPLHQLHHLVWGNSIDLRDPQMPRWGLIDQALAIGSTMPVPGDGRGDIATPDRSMMWLDGGPVRFTAPLDGVPVLHAVAVEHGSLVPPLDNETSAALAVDQLAAVTHPGGAARIIAPAGSGKTRVLTERVRHLLTRWRLPPSAVSLVAFNKRAQEEMRARTTDLAGMQVRTLNSIALAIINGSPPFAARPNRVETIDEVRVRRILGDLVSFPRRRNTDPVAPWIEALGQIRLGLLDPVEVESRYEGDVDGIPQIWPAYRAALHRHGVVDFDGQIHGAIELLLAEPQIRAAAQRACRVLLVDEFQDLTPAHVLLIRLLSAPGGTVFGVGDDDQTIYGYNGADPGWLIDFHEMFPGAGTHPLEVNYRCPVDVVEVVDRLLRHNRRRVPKMIRAADRPPAGDGPEPGSSAGWSVAATDDPVADTVRAVTSAIGTGIPAADIAVLSRVNAMLAPVQVALASSGVPLSGGVGLEFADRTSVRAALAWLRLAQGRFTPDDLHEALRRPSRPLHPRISDWVAEQRDVDGLHRLAARLNEERESDRVAAFADDIESMQALVAAGEPTRRIFEVLIDDLNLGGSVATLDANRRGMNRSSQGDDLGAVRLLAAQHDDAVTFESWLRRHLAVQRDPAGVVLSTVHRVKGQEWPVVVVHLADHEQYPHRLADDVEEERRLFHVAMSRASRHVTITTGPRPSPFVDELTTEPPAHRPEPPPVVSTSPSSRSHGMSTRESGPVHPLLDRDHVVVAPGMVIVDQGTSWTITGVEPEHVTARQGAAERRFRLGAAVVTEGRQRGALQPPTDEIPAPTARAYDLLRTFRERTRGTRPAYTVFDDKTLAAIASALPSSLDELNQVRGVGPAKLEQYGSDLLDIVEAAIVPDAG